MADQPQNLAAPTISLTRLEANGQALVQAVNNLNQTVNTTFPQFVATSATATTGAATLPAHPVGFLQLTIPGVGPVSIPYYAT